MTDFAVVRDTRVIDAIDARLAGMLDPPWHLHLAACQARGWQVVPREKGRHFESNDAALVVAAAAKANTTRCYARAAEPTGEYPGCYQFAPLLGGFLAFADECATLNFAIVPDPFAFLVLCTSEDYNLYAAPVELLEILLGSNVPDARARFRAYAADPWWKGRLAAVAKRYGG
jgi:hypothetical protein